MSKLDKRLQQALANPGAIRFDDACAIARALGFSHEGGRGSHRVFKRAGEPVQLNFQDRDGFIPAYQGRQLAAMIRKYGGML
jgi:hypothetical protein